MQNIEREILPRNALWMRRITKFSKSEEAKYARVNTKRKNPLKRIS